MKALPNLLIVDDSEENLAFLESITRKTKVNLVPALSGAEALEVTSGMELALAIIDVRMPGMNGYELAIKLNETRSDDKVPIIFLTASHVDDIQVFEGYGLGAVDYIFKPVDHLILLCKVNVFIDLFNQKQTILRNVSELQQSADELTRVNAALKKSEEKYRSYIDHAPDGVFIADETGKYIEVNEAACAITGYSEQELIKMSIADILPEESMEAGLAHFKQVVRTGSSRVDMRFSHKSGVTRWWTVEAVKLSDTRFLGFAKDITHRKEMEETLRSYQVELEMQNEELTQALKKIEIASGKYIELYDFAPSGYFTLSEEKAIIDLNHSGALMLGKERSLFINSDFSLFVARESLPVFMLFFQRIFTIRTKETCEILLVTNSGQQKYVHIEGVIAEDNKNCLINVVDITERKQAEEEIRHVNSLLDSIVENIPNMIFLKDAQHFRFVQFNRAGEELLGLSREELIGKSDYDFFTKLQADSFIEKDREVLRSMKMVDIAEEPIQTRHQGIRILHTKKVPVLNAAGEPEYLLGISEDITEHKKAEQAMKVSEEKYKTMLNASPDGILLTNMKGIITEVSEIGLELFSADSRDDLVGKNIYRFVPPKEKNTLREIIEKTINEGLAQNIGLNIKKKNQAIFASETSATLIQGPDGTPVSFMIIVRDISHRKKMETKQIHADRMANLGEMASGIAHEINQPLNIISMVMDKILFESAKTETIDLEFLKTKSNRIFENITRIRNIIDHIRAFSRSHDDFVLTAFDINSTIENAVSMIMEQFKHLGISLNLQLGKQIPQIFGNTYKFEQVIVNLLVNAKDAVIDKKNKQDDYGEMIVEIRSYLEHQLLVVEVTDNGIGIGNDDINNVMLPFYTTKDEGKGTGLGLSICYQIIREMGGTVDIISDRMTGTKIRLVLDIQKKK